MQYIEKNDKNKRKKHFYIGNEFDIQTELERTIKVIDDTIEKAEELWGYT